MNEPTYEELLILGTLLEYWEESHYMIDDTGLTADHFESDVCGEVFKAIIRVSENGDQPHLLTVVKELDQEASEVAQIAMGNSDMGESKALFLNTCRSIINASKERLLKNKLLRLIQDDGYENIIGQLGDVYDEAIVGCGKDETIADICNNVIHDYDHGIVEGLPSMFGKLNRVMTYRGMCVIGARPGAGKTTFALQETASQLGSGKRVGFVSVEMPASQCIQRIIANVGNVHGYRMMNRRLTTSEANKMRETARELANMPLFFAPDETQDIHKICSWIEYAVKRHKVEFIVVDYLQLIKGRFNNRYEAVTDISNSLARLQKKLGIPFMVLSQLRRPSDSSTVKPPTMADLRESGSIEQDATSIILLHKKYEDKEIVQATLEKNRHGQTTRFELDAQFAYYRFVERDEDY